MATETYDVVVVGSGAEGTAAVITARNHGTSVLVIKKDEAIGCSTVRSGGVLWIPHNSLSRAAGVVDEEEHVTSYLKHEAGRAFDANRFWAFVRNGSRMVDWFQKETSVKFVAVPEFSDYHPPAADGRPGGRSILAAPFDGRALGKRLGWLRPPLPENTFVGMMFNAGQEIKHFFNATRSMRSVCYVAKPTWTAPVCSRRSTNSPKVPDKAVTGNSVAVNLHTTDSCVTHVVCRITASLTSRVALSTRSTSGLRS
ncbi:FAD-binding protein [Burkholderia sp. SCN-KJ]|uniref:FAD-binding protein n=1 Tax=Burkholderia sp. SCN-KJ TaxID=2969248 RepID=UPI0035B423CA